MMKTREDSTLELQAEIRDTARPHRLKVKWREGLLAEVGIHGPGSADKLFQALPSLPNEPLPPLHAPEIPSLPDLPTEPLPPLHEQI